MSKRNQIALARKSLGFKVLFAFIVVIVLVLTVFTVFAALREGRKTKQGLREQGEVLAAILSGSATVAVFSENKQALKEEADGIAGQRHVVSAEIYGADLKLLYAAADPSSPKSTRPLPQGAAGGQTTAELFKVIESRDAFEFIKPVILQPAAQKDEALYLGGAVESRAGKVIGYVRIVLTKDVYHKEVASIIAQHVLVMLTLIIASIGIVTVAVRRMTRPLIRLTDTVKALEKGLRVEPLPIETGDEVGNLASAFNAMVVARRQVEESLQESEERYRQVVELSPDAIYVQREGIIVFINPAGARLFGASDPPKALGRQVLDFVHEEDRRMAGEKFLQVEEEGLSCPFLPLRYVRPDGTVADAEAAAAPFTFIGREAALVIARDVTVRKGMEEQIRIYENELLTVASEMTSLESQVEERERNFIAADLHDFVGQNLVASQFKLGMLRKHLPGPEASAHLDELRNLIGQTIQYTRSLTVELCPPVLTEVGFRAALESLAEGFQKAHGLEVILENDDGPMQMEVTVRYLLFRSVRELLMNVVKHAQANTVNISTARIDDRLRIMVTDDGIGFDAADGMRKKAGFGLFTIRERMKGLGGHCEVETAPGSGTRVTLTAPFKQ